MIEIVKGHTYMLQNLKSAESTELKFYMDPLIHGGDAQDGPSTQEVIRACIARVKALDAERPGPENTAIIEHLRQAIILHELRALRLKLNGDPYMETIMVGRDGHVFVLCDEIED